MMMDAAVMQPATAAAGGFPHRDYRHLMQVREKFREVFGSACPLRDEMLLERYNITPDGDLVMILR